MSKQRILGDLAHNLDSSAVGSFLAKSSAGGDFKKVSYSLVSGTPSALDSSLSQAIIDSAYIQARQTAAGVAGLDSATMLALIDSSYISGIHGTNTGFDQYYYNATAGQTIFDSDLRGRNLSYEENGVMVFLNGVMLAPSQYTATDGSTVVLDSAASLSDEVTVVKFALGSSGGGGGAAVWYGDRGVLGGGYDMDALGATNTIAYFDITTLGNASDFGDLTTARYYLGAVSDGTYGVFGGGNTDSRSNVMDYITIATTGNATDFGDFDAAREEAHGASNGTTGLFMGGYDTGYSNAIISITIATPGNATDFGDLTISVQKGNACSNGTYGVHGGGQTGSTSYEDTIGYVTIASAGNASDFGNLTTARQYPGAAGNSTYGIFAGGRAASSNTNTMDYITIASPGNATDFGDLSVTRKGPEGAGNATRATFGPGVQGSSQAVIEYVAFDTPGNAADFGDPTINYGSYYAATSGSPS